MLEAVFGSDDGSVYAVNRDDGSLLWSYVTVGPVVSSPALGDVNGDNRIDVVVGSDGGHIYALGGMTGVAEGDQIPGKVGALLYENDANPFVGATSITYSINERGFVSVMVYDASGRTVVSLVNESQDAGTHIVQLDARGLPRGVYFCTLGFNGMLTCTRKMVLCR